MSSSGGKYTSVAAGDLQIVSTEKPPRPPASSTSSSNALVEYTPPAINPEEEDLEIKLRRIIECVPVRVSNTSGSSAGSGSGDFHQVFTTRILNHLASGMSISSWLFHSELIVTNCVLFQISTLSWHA